MIQAIRGMNDILPEETPAWQYIEQTFQILMARYGYQEIRFPIVESTDLFKRTIGEETDIVGKEMYTFEDRNGDSLTLRPEGTACCVRAGLERGLFHNQVQRLWYMGPMFRYEKPQKGRYRQFFQFGVEAFGLSGPDIDAEIILMMARFWKELGISDDIRLQLNSLGTSESRAGYRKALVNYFKQFEDRLDEDSKRRLPTNPMRILDSKNPDMQDFIQGVPSLFDYLDKESKEHFETLCQRLDDAGLIYEINPRLVRGLDYYSRTVFEWVTDKLGSQNAVCAGGRFDGLVELLGGKSTPAIGFAMGIERLIALLETLKVMPAFDQYPDVYMILIGEKAEKVGLLLAEQLRTHLPRLKLLMHVGGGSLKSQFKKADKSGANIALVLGDEELANDSVTVKFLRADQPQKIIKQSDLKAFLVDPKNR